MFRRTSKTETPAADAVDKGPGGKGHPTPSRRQAEAASRLRAKGAVDKKAAQRLSRDRRNEQNAKVREAMRTGDERYLPQRDKGPVKRFIRNYVDSRLTIVEFLLPLLLVIWVMQASGNTSLQHLSTALWTTTIVVVAADTLWLIFRVRRALRQQLPDESLRGTTSYLLMRVVQIRPLRQPKPQVKVGGRPK
ncbi:MAG: DUF3043 domain-containing protein [Marmoricola sp.]|nr:DUF3043 domain-containing protein [Marmoricola sp.]